MLIRGFAPSRYTVGVSQWQAFEITGAGVGPMLTASNIVMVAGYLAIALVYVMWLRRSDRTIVDAALLVVLVITVIIVTNKTFSPQYMMWLGGPLAALLVAAGRAPREQQAPVWRDLRALTYWVLGLTLATQLVYPVLYEPLVHGGSLLVLATIILVLRNIGMVVFLVWQILLVRRTLLRGQDTRAARRRSERTAR
jgi:hypothetical protein